MDVIIIKSVVVMAVGLFKALEVFLLGLVWDWISQGAAKTVIT